ncbi:alpha/beta hydrolase [Microbacterium sp. IEGM 1404]|uniref:alpha/beta hydrolase n=1 Tax=Microbacterium sp. IEGM 1404 TaxID=3047084 RepID=UPI0024B837D2|nr:alpha/beta hydrolase [Microbacterium sp. IEGM 1404]MDI9892046.1 alpha/beta hydrolase [Microbacterium sp. IEGM 1404]
MTDTSPSADGAPRAPRRRFRVLRWILAGLGALVLLLVAGILIYSQVGVMGAEPDPLAEARANPGLTITEDSTAVILTPVAGDTGRGLVFIPGAKVDALGYVATFEDTVVDDGVTVVITRPWLNLAFFDPRPLSTFTDLAPDVSAWAVGGHSLGGVRACQLAGDADALVLFASYCANDLSGAGLPVLSLSGSEDGLSTPQKIADAAKELPADAVFVEIPGASHASFGAYGPQAGDGTPTADPAEVDRVIAEQLAAFLPTP